MILRHEASQLALKMAVCLGVAGGCSFLGCSSDYGTAPSSKAAVKEYLDKNATANQAAKGVRGKGITTGNIKQKALAGAPGH